MFGKSFPERQGYGTSALLRQAVDLLLVIGMASVTNHALAQGKLVPVYPITESTEISAHKPVLLLPPKVTHDSFKVRKHKRAVGIDEESIARWIYSVESQTLQELGLTLLDTEDLFEDESSADEMVNTAESIVRGRDLPGDCPGVLQEMKRGYPGMAILFQHLKIKLAPKGSWDSFSGAMAVGMSNSNLKGVMLDCETGEVLWQGELYIRMIPEVGNARFQAAVAGIFQNLSVKESSHAASD